MLAPFKYRAFISYSHKDAQWGQWAHRALENYRVPKHLVGSEGRDGPVPARLFPIFRDREELPSSSNLSEQIKDALEQSAYLIVICSPNATASRWVNEEILAFSRLGRAHRILALIVDGEPNAAGKPGGEAAIECFPNALKFRMDAGGVLTDEPVEPLAADARPQGDGQENAKLKLIAGLLGVGYDALKRRDEQAARRRARIYRAIAGAMALLALLAVGAAWYAFQMQDQAEHQRDLTLQAQSRSLTQTAAASLRDGDIATASSTILEILSRRSTAQSPDPAAVNVFQEARARDRQLAVLSGHLDEVAFSSWSPDGKRVVTASYDKTARVWDAANGVQLAVLYGHGNDVYSAAWSPDGKNIVTASIDKTARIWKADTGIQLFVLSGHSSAVLSAAYSPDGKRVVTASADKTARVWDALTGHQLAVLAGHADSVNSAAWSPDGRRIITVSGDKTERIWDGATYAQLVVLSGHAAAVESAAWSPDMKRIVTTSDDKTARVWDAATGKQLVVLSGHDNYVFSAAWSRDGKRIVTASADKTVRIWDSVKGTQLDQFAGHGNFVYSAAWSPAEDRILTTSKDMTARIWSASPRNRLALLSGHTDEVLFAAYSPDGKRIVTASNDKTVRIWDAATNVVLASVTGHTDMVRSAAWSPDGKSIVTASNDRTARIWDAGSGRQLAVLSGHTDAVNSASWSPDGKRIVTVSSDKTVRLWDAAKSTKLVVLSGHSDMVESAAWSPDGKRIVTVSDDKTARIWDATTAVQIATLAGHGGPVYAAAWSPDGKRIATASADKTGRIWDAGTAAQLGVLYGHDDVVSTIAWSPDGKRIVTGSGDKTARIWDAATSVQLAVLSGHSALIESVGWSPDGKRIVTASDDNTAVIWDARAEEFDTQLSWAAAAQLDPLPADERERLGLLPPSYQHDWPHEASLCDRAAAAPYDPDRRAPGAMRDQIVVDIAVAACSLPAASAEDQPRLEYQRGRALMAKGDIAGARREFEQAISDGYSSAGIDLGDLLSDSSYAKLDVARAVSLYQQALRNGVAIAAFRLGELYERGIRQSRRVILPPDGTKAWSWYAQGADLNEPDALGRFGAAEDASAVVAPTEAERNEHLVNGFKYYAAASERAQQEEWPDNSWRTWRYRRASIARIFAHQGMMRQIAEAYDSVRQKYAPPVPTMLGRFRRWLERL